MPTLVKIRGLARGGAVGDSGVLKGSRGFRLQSNLVGKQGGSGVVAATLVPTANTQSYTARYGGAYGNNIEIQTVVGALAVAVNIEATSGDPEIVVTAPATATLAANQAVVAMVNAHPVASQYVVAAIAGTGAAAHAVVASTNLASGADGTGSTNVPIWLNVSNSATIVVDVDLPANAKNLRRSAGNYISLGSP